MTDKKNLTEEERELLEHIVDLEEVPDLYLSFISDPIKNEIRSKDSAYFEEHIGEYLNLWINVGLRHPGAYVRAWLDQTKGFWNGGYDYEIISVTNHRTFGNYFDLDQSIHETPILLLDDVLSELDSNRQNYLLNSIHETQTLITCT